MKRFLVMLYPGFCNFEIAALTEILAFEDEWTMTTVAAEQKLYTSEDQMQVMAEKDFLQVNPLDYDLIILPGIDDYHLPLSDPRNAAFLKQLDVTGPRPVIAAMSSSPILLAKAGLLAHTKFTAGIFEETYTRIRLSRRKTWSANQSSRTTVSSPPASNSSVSLRLLPRGRVA